MSDCRELSDQVICPHYMTPQRGISNKLEIFSKLSKLNVLVSQSGFIDFNKTTQNIFMGIGGGNLDARNKILLLF